MRLIDKDALYEALVTGDIRETHQFCYPCKKVLEAIDAQPTVESQRMKGRWIHDGYDIPHGVDWMHCSVCGRREPYVPAAMTNYCPTCGTEMETEQQ